MNRYSKPCLQVIKVKIENILQASYDKNTETSTSAVSLGKEGMTPVSEDNASSIWED